MSKSGRILLAAELGDEYGFVDINGECPEIVKIWFVIYSITYKENKKLWSQSVAIWIWCELALRHQEIIVLFLWNS